MAILINLNDARKKLNELEGSAEYNKGVTDAFNALFDLPTIKVIEVSAIEEYINEQRRLRDGFSLQSREWSIINTQLIGYSIMLGCLVYSGKRKTDEVEE